MTTGNIVFVGISFAAVLKTFRDTSASVTRYPIEQRKSE